MTTDLREVPVTIKPAIPTLSPVWTLRRVERLRGCDPGVGVAVGVELGPGVEEAVAVGVGAGVPVGAGVAVGVGLPQVPSEAGAWIGTVIGVPVLKKPTVALAACGGSGESKRKV
jgi:hypothetical protein